MTDAVREYKEWVRENYAKHAAEMWNPMDAGYANGIDATETKADAAIAELEAKLHTLGHDYDALRDLLEAVENARNDWREKCQKAEAEARRWEVVAKQACRDRRTPDGHLLDTLLARYEEEGHWTA